jgi:glucose-1-phosphate thymidylyltransferase
MRADAGTELTAEQQRFADAGIKALIPVAEGKTLLELIIENLAAAGFSDVCLVIGPEHTAIRDFCRERGLAIAFAEQAEAKGTADAVLAAESWVGEDIFLAVNSDNLYPAESLRRLRASGRPAMLAFARDSLIERSNIAPERIAKFATVEIDTRGCLVNIAEKPESVGADSAVSMNAWLLPPAIFAACRSIAPSVRGEYEITAAVQYLIDEMGVDVAAIRSDEGVLDLSSRADIEAVSRMLEDRETL